ncbi:MAG: hypothetical protein ACYC64_02735 [Armatimonadota bacterium]
MQRLRIIMLAAISVAVCFVSSSVVVASMVEKRVLIVTNDTPTKTPMYALNNGEYVATDLVASGYPFDVVTYSRFVNMDLGCHDIIVLNGHTSPIPVSNISAKCTSALQEGRKVFINGDFPFMRYDSGVRVEEVRYSCSLFNVTSPGVRYLTGNKQLPASIEKNPIISAMSEGSFWYTAYNVPSNRSPMLISTGGVTTGFLLPEGGAISGRDSSLQQSLLDYGKVVTYLRYPDNQIVGFANDRIEGKPVVSFEVHCDSSSDLVAIGRLDSVSQQYGLPLINLLVYSRLTPAAINKWNSLANPLMTFGSHTYSHPPDWPSLPSVLWETSNAIALQKQVVPGTKNYLNFSGSMNPTPAQIDQVADAGVVFGASGGYEMRDFKTISGSRYSLQRLPTTQSWLQNLAECTNTQFCSSYTLPSDWTCWNESQDFTQTVELEYARNIKNGMYNFGCVHDYMFNPAGKYYCNNVHMSSFILAALDYISKRSAKFVAADDLVLRLHDFQAGWIDHVVEPDGSTSISVHRPSGRANDIKIRRTNNNVPVASGASVLSQHLSEDFLYVTLQPEVNSTFSVRFVSSTDFQSQLTPKPTLCIISWMTPSMDNLSSMVVRYDKNCFPSSPNDGIGFGSQAAIPGTKQQISAPVDWANMDTAYFSIFPCATNGYVLSSPCTLLGHVDRTPPTKPRVALAISPSSNLTASWVSEDAESGVDNYSYAIGTSSGASNVVPWTSVEATSTVIGSLDNVQNLYLSVKAENPFGYTSDVFSCPVTETIITAISGPDDSPVTITGLVSAVFADCYYVEQSTRVRGIKVMETPQDIAVGDRVLVTGTLGTIAGERVVLPNR